MRVTVTIAVAVAALLTTAALAEQVGSPSGPERGQFNVGAEGLFRTNLQGYTSGPTFQYGDRWKSRTLYGVLEYGLTDCLSIRGKAGLAEWEEDDPVSSWRTRFGYGLAWAAGFRWRICRPEEHGTSLALSGQYAESHPDDWPLPIAILPPYRAAKSKEFTGALTVGVPHGSARPYAGLVYSDVELGWEFPITVPAVPFRFDKEDHFGALVGLEHDMGSAGFLNIEARFFDEEGIAASANFTF